jgi:pimeloyl-ACP methyl ester carboxylesterase
MIKPHSSFVDVDDLRLHYLVWDNKLAQKKQPEENLVVEQDNDDVPIVLLHGLSATADTWNQVAEHLYQNYQVIAFDLRGHGQSDQPANGYDLVTIAEDVIQGMAALGLGQVALVGHGWGARVALTLAARHPALISHLILVDCPHVEPKHWPGMTRERFIRERSAKEIYDSLQDFTETMRQEMDSFWSPEIAEIVSTYVHVLPDGRVEEHLKPEHQRRIRESVWEDRALAYYGKLTCPVLLVPAAAEPQPGEEPPERLEDAEEFAAAKGYMAAQVQRAIQHCSVFWMPDTVHDIQLQRPKVLAKAIADFIKA